MFNMEKRYRNKIIIIIIIIIIILRSSYVSRVHHFGEIFAYVTFIIQP